MSTESKTETIEIEMIQGTKYFLCTCGLAKTQPFCDGSHKGTGMKSLHYTADKSGKHYFCRTPHSAGVSDGKPG